MNYESYFERYYEVRCRTGIYKLKPVKVWTTYSKVAGVKTRVNVIAYFICPDGTHVCSRIDYFDL